MQVNKIENRMGRNNLIGSKAINVEFNTVVLDKLLGHLKKIKSSIWKMDWFAKDII